jgi:hypothetical protein
MDYPPTSYQHPSHATSHHPIAYQQPYHPPKSHNGLVFLMGILITTIIFALILAYTNVYESTFRNVIKNTSLFPANMWATQLKYDKDYDPFVDSYKLSLCQQLNESECGSSTMQDFCEFDTGSCRMKNVNERPTYRTSDFATASSKIHRQICTDIDINQCQGGGLCEVVDARCVPLSDSA